MEAAYTDTAANQWQNHLNEAKHVQKICQTSDWLVGYVGGCDISNGEMYTRKFLEELRDSDGKLSSWLKGLRIVQFGKPEGTVWYHEEMRKALGVLGEEELIWEIGADLEDLRQVPRMLEENPGVRFTLCHCGSNRLGRFGKEGMVEWKKLITEVGKFENVVCKLGGQEESEVDPVEVLKHCIESFGWDRGVAESNWFVCEGLGWKLDKPFDLLSQACDELGATQAQRDKVFWINAERWYNC